ncbi:MAG: hypothetical protein BZY82_00350 [SAR202 cluster bacterium Io17-Chloro-G3]|nr:MAG: hypothetical protein BZY82_00350 [SAR202 cluster bacterium Io17-Chloro-G3]
MIGLFLVLLAALLFAQAWYFLGLYADARTFGFIAAALAVGLAASVGGSFEAVIISRDATLTLLAFRGFVILWAVYGAAVAAHALWGFEERAIGFHSLFLWAASMTYMVAIPFTQEAHVSDDAALVLSGSSLVLSIISAMVFFHLAIPFRELRTVAGWFLLVGAVIVAALGMTVFFGILG